ncbi:MAG TPA: ABC transporter permease [Pseudochrobactrum sp.]|nr:ABC transporter permease [Pseudochrobactrum sp.]
MKLELSEKHEAFILSAAQPKSGFNVALKDIFEALLKYRLALVFGWQDVAQRYRRSRVGAFWLTLNMAVFIGALGLIFGTIFQSSMNEFLPYLCAGVVVWTFVSTALTEGCTTFSSSDGMILQIKMPLFIHVMRALWRNIIILAHNIVIFPVLVIIVGGEVNFNVFWLVPGFAILCINLAWMMLVLAIICARFRDMTQVTVNILQVLFYATPIMWMMKVLPPHVSKDFINWNPFFHLIELLRAPLLGASPSDLNWGVSVVVAILGWFIAIALFGKYRWRVAYWL